MAVSVRRDAQLAANLQSVEQRLSAACAAAGRRRTDINVVAVTKTFPSSDVAALCGLGLRDFGENRDAEARAKAIELQPALPGLRWHFVGRLQRNKCRSVASYAEVVHSIDRVELVRALDDGAGRVARLIDVMVQASLDGDPRRGGVQRADLAAVAERCEAAANLRLVGVMAVAPAQSPPGEAFARLAEIAADLRAAHPQATAISAGMSGDFEAAVRHGATHLRLGTALLGHRTPQPG